MKYKVADRVRIKSIDWYNKNKDKDNDGCIECGKDSFVKDMSEYCGQIATITKIFNDEYHLNIDDGFWSWTDEMIEELVKEPITLNSKEVLLKLANIELPSGTTNIWECPKGYQFVDENGNVINATKIVLEKKKKEYPKTYEECCKVLGLEYIGIKRNENNYSANCYKNNLICAFIELLICRDAYWKIAGEEMGLGKAWEPDWIRDTPKYCIICNDGEVANFATYGYNRILAFPTEEMRDAFYENFKNEIKQCKELL